MNHPLMRSVVAGKRSLIQTPGHVIRATGVIVDAGRHPFSENKNEKGE